ncbi:PIN domain-containing protein [Corynebacterium epidermidicanis]|uniref:PIN domain n=1 Tax=Corynebacterium epidermidicanis TaxID=1050174 RepID=A0A0G3GXP1_9CORY|nr:PIN domain-containing protein [Corynebacterium epidermidicanis]AKK04293.1 PIN domain [Corynebacterium epidermidicanis]
MSYVPVSNSVLPDANVWFSTTLHSWLGLLAAETLGTWTFHWTEDIIAEAMYNKRKEYPHTSSHQIEAIRDRLLNTPSTRISGFEIDRSVNYPDRFDAHVHSAALHGRVQIIVTDDRKGFVGLYPDPDKCPYEVYTADEFLMLVGDSAPEAIDEVIKQQFFYFSNKKISFNLASRLQDAGCPEFAEYVRKRLQELPLT